MADTWSLWVPIKIDPSNVSGSSMINDVTEEKHVQWSDVKDLEDGALDFDIETLSQEKPRVPQEIAETAYRKGIEVFLSQGTVVLVSKDALGTKTFDGFAHNKSSYKVPVHRYVEREQSARTTLKDLQKQYDAFVTPDNKDAVDYALATMQEVGYAYPGLSWSSNASVGIVYARCEVDSEGNSKFPDRVDLFACVNVACANKLPVMVQVRHTIPKPMFDRDMDWRMTLYYLAEMGRDAIRTDFLMPVVVDVQK